MLLERIKNKFQKFKEIYLTYSTYRSWNKRFVKVSENVNFQSFNLSSLEKNEYYLKWKIFNLKLNYDTVKLCTYLSNRYDSNIVPEEIFRLKIEPKLNSNKDVKFLANKNIYNKWFKEGEFPKDYFHKINDSFYDSSLKLISNINSFIENTDFKFPIVIKPSKDTSGGDGVLFIDNKEDIIKNISIGKNLIIQEKLIQSSLMNKINNGINTVRVCLLRHPYTNELLILNSSLRMGIDGGLDNESAGGIVCNCDDSGYFNEYAVNKYANKFLYHPNSKFEFKDKRLPKYDDLCKKSIEISSQVFDLKLISLDMFLNHKDEWQCIEVNLNAQTIRFSQYAGNPFFGIYTNDIIKYVNENSNT